MERESLFAAQCPTPKQWAWEFLRLNPGYREAYSFVSSLTTAQRAALHDLEFGISDTYSLSESTLSLPSELIYLSFPYEFPESAGTTLAEIHETFKSYQSDLTGKHELTICLKAQFNRNSYFLTEWTDIFSGPLTEDEARVFWHYSPEWRANIVPLSESVTSLPLYQGLKEELRTHCLTDKGRLTAIPDTPYLVSHDGSMFLNGISVPAKATLSQFEVEVTFNVSLPLEVQLEEIEAVLERQRKELEKAGLLVVARRNVEPHDQNAFEDYVDLLERLLIHKSAAAVARSLVPDTDEHCERNRKAIEDQFPAAIKLRDLDYATLALS